MDAIYRELIGEDASPPRKNGRAPKPAEHKPRNRAATTDPVYLDAKIRRENAAALKIELQNAAGSERASAGEVGRGGMVRRSSRRASRRARRPQPCAARACRTCLLTTCR